MVLRWRLQTKSIHLMKWLWEYFCNILSSQGRTKSLDSVLELHRIQQRSSLGFLQVQRQTPATQSIRFNFPVARIQSDLAVRSDEQCFEILHYKHQLSALQWSENDNDSAVLLRGFRAEAPRPLPTSCCLLSPAKSPQHLTAPQASTATIWHSAVWS